MFFYRGANQNSGIDFKQPIRYWQQKTFEPTCLRFEKNREIHGLWKATWTQKAIFDIFGKMKSKKLFALFILKKSYVIVKIILKYFLIKFSPFSSVIYVSYLCFMLKFLLTTFFLALELIFFPFLVWITILPFDHTPSIYQANVHKSEDRKIGRSKDFSKCSVFFFFS